MNKCIISGRLTADPESHYMESGKRGKDDYLLSNFTVAVYRDKDTSEFFRCSAIGKTAEYIEKYAVKGGRILVEGNMHFDSHQEKGTWYNYFTLYVDRAEVIDYYNGEDETEEPPEEKEEPKKKPARNSGRTEKKENPKRGRR